MLKNEEQKALAGVCCDNAVTSLVTAGHRAGEDVAAGAGTAPAVAAKAAKRSESIVEDDCIRWGNDNHKTKCTVDGVSWRLVIYTRAYAVNLWTVTSGGQHTTL
jgi:hypothetical protein